MRFSRSFLSALLAVGLAACSSGASKSQPAVEPGGVKIVVPSQRFMGTGINLVLIQVTSPSSVVTEYSLLPTTAANGNITWEITLNRLAQGTYTVDAKAFAGGSSVWTDPADYQTFGSGSFTILPNQTVTASIFLTQVAAAGTVSNGAPIINSVVASVAAVDSSAGHQPITLTVNASDPDGDSLSYLWTDDAFGVFGNDVGQTTTWDPPTGTNQNVNITIDVSDLPVGNDPSHAIVTLTLNVSPNNGRGSVYTVVDINALPSITAVSTSDAQLTPGASAIVLGVAADPDGDVVTGTWSDSCGGTFSPTTGVVDPVNGLAATYTASATANGDCTISFSVTDGRSAGSIVGTLVVHVAGFGVSYNPEFLAPPDTTMSAIPASTGGNVNFTASAVQFNGATYDPVSTYAWSATRAQNGGAATALPASAFVATGGTTTATATLATGLCGTDLPALSTNAFVVSVLATGAGGLTAQYNYSFTITCP